MVTWIRIAFVGNTIALRGCFETLPQIAEQIVLSVGRRFSVIAACNRFASQGPATVIDPSLPQGTVHTPDIALHRRACPCDNTQRYSPYPPARHPLLPNSSKSLCPSMQSGDSVCCRCAVSRVRARRKVHRKTGLSFSAPPRCSRSIACHKPLRELRGLLGILSDRIECQHTQPITSASTAAAAIQVFGF